MSSPCPTVLFPATKNIGPKDWPVLKLQQNLPATVTATFYGTDGAPIQLSSDSAPAPAGPPAETATTGLEVSILDTTNYGTATQARIWIKQDPTDVQVVPVTGAYQGDGVYTFAFSEANLSSPGLFIGDIQLLDSADKLLVNRRCYVEIEQNNTDGTLRNQPLTTSEIRLALRDWGDSNLLLEDYEFSDKEIQFCIRQPVDYWNEADPPVAYFTYSAFPFRYNWTQATIACLLKQIAHWYRRNKLDYTAGGVSVQQMNKDKDYLAVGTQMWDDYRAWVQNKKITINVAGGFAYVPGAWSL